MKKIIVWDLPIRVFHFVFAGSLSAALAIGFLVDDDSPLFQFHMLFGLVAAAALVLRLVLGVVGSRYNRFTALPLKPGEVVRYFAGAVTGSARRYIGHNPGAAVAALTMFALVPLLIASGIGWLDDDLHEGLAIALLVVIGGHLAGLVWHTVRHREAIALSMVTGRKDGPEGEGLTSAHPVWAGAILAAGVAWITALFANHDAKAATVKLPLIGTVISLGENEGNEGEEHGDHREHGERGEKDDD
ncbi:MAG TPA: cytochrome b/b6 domain-containing protein [Rariglobus sp.]